MEFKKGDKVRLVSTDTRYVSDKEWGKVGKFEISEKDFNTSDIYIISNIDLKDNSVFVKGWWFPKEYFKLVEEYTPKSDLKVGDKIKALVDFPSSRGVRKGEIGTIEKVGNEAYLFKVNFPSQSSCYISIKQILDTSLYALVEEDKPYNLNPYVGEYLVVIKDTMFHAIPLKIGEFIKVGELDKWKHSKNPSSNYIGGDKYPSDIFRKVTLEEKLEAIQAFGIDVSNFEKDNFLVGDVIKVVTYSLSTLPYGSILRVTEGIDSKDGFEAIDDKGVLHLLTANQGYYVKIDSNPKLEYYSKDIEIEDLLPISETKSRNVTIDRSEPERIVGIIPTKHIIINR